MEPRQIAFVGAGNMATAIIAGLVKAGYPADSIIATDPNSDSRVRLGETYGIFTSGDNALAVDDADVVVLAVKPQLMETVMGGLKDIDWSGKLVISIAAGISVARLNQLAGAELSVVRVMPNTPALVSKGMSGLFAAASVSDADRDFAGKLMQAVGEVCWVEKESGINAVIAAAGSAPAYFFRFMEAMQEEAVRQALMPRPHVCWFSSLLWALLKWWLPTRICHCLPCASRSLQKAVRQQKRCAYLMKITSLTPYLTP